MSIDYELRIATEWQQSQGLDRLSNKLNLEWGEYPRLFNSDIILAVFPERKERQDMMQKTFGFEPKIDLWLRTKRNGDEKQGKQTLLQAVMLLLSEMPGDLASVKLPYYQQPLRSPIISEELTFGGTGQWHLHSSAQFSSQSGQRCQRIGNGCDRGLFAVPGEKPRGRPSIVVQ